MYTKYAIVFNRTTDPITVDDDGRVVEPGSWAAVQRYTVQDQITGGQLITLDPDCIDDMSDSRAWEAKQRYDKLVAEWEKEKAAEESLPEDGSKHLPGFEDQPPVGSDYDEDSSSKTTKAKKKS